MLFLAVACNKTQIQSVQNQQPAVVSGMENWRSYRNDESAFEIKYPSEWISIEQPNPGEKAKFGILIYKSERSNTIKPGGLALYSYMPLGFKGTNSNTFVSLDQNYESKIHFVVNGQDIFATCALYLPEYSATDVKICNQILSTFKFTK